MGRLSLAVLGTPQIGHAGQLVALPTRKTQALLIYLAVEGGYHSREKLIALFWPESDEERGRRSLRTALAFLRSALRETTGDESGHQGMSQVPHLVVDRTTLAVASSVDVDLDLHTLDAAFALARGTSQLPPGELIARLRAAARLYRGDFLEGFSLDDSPAFDEWASAQREACHRRADLVFDRLSQVLSEGGEWLDAIEVTARWIALNPLNEAAHRRLIQLHITAGDRAAALRAYDACRTILADELNAEPARETEALGQRLRAEVPAAREAPAWEPLTPTIAVEGPLVGRLAEHAQLVVVYRSVRRGKAQVVTIEGDPGIGKTRLATAFLRWAVAQGADVLRSRAFETGDRLPYQPVVEALRGRLSREDQDEHRAWSEGARPLLTRVWLAELSRLLPELRERNHNLPLPLRLGEAEARVRLFEAVARLGKALAARRPVVFFVDDVQWADAASRDVLQYVARRWTSDDTAVMLILGMRTGDLGTDHALDTWLTDLARDVPLARLTPGLLTAEDTLRIVRALSPAADAGPQSFSRWLFAETSGHPLYITETIKALWERGLIKRDATGQLTIPFTPLGDATSELRGLVPAGVRAVIRARFAGLSSDAREVLDIAAVVGDGFEVDQVFPVAGMPEDQAVAALEELLARRLMREAGNRYLFWHDKIREVAYVEMSEARRRLYHRRALDALVARQARAATLVRHALAAGLVEQAFRYSLAAGDDALQMFAARDAIAHYEQACRLAAEAERPGSHSPFAPQRSELHHLYLQLGRAHELTAEPARARAVYEGMLAFARQVGDPQAECRALNRLANLEVADRVDLHAQAALLQSALVVAEASSDASALAETEWNLARHSFFRTDLVAAHSYAERSLARARDLGLTEQVARNLNWMALMEPVAGQWSKARSHAEEARAMYATLGDRVMETDSLIQLAVSSILSGYLEPGLTAARTARTISLEIDNVGGLAASAMALVHGLLDTGEYQQALEIAEAGVISARQAAFLPLLLMNLVLLGITQRRLGQFDAALASHLEARSVYERLQWPGFLDLVAAELCADRLVAGDGLQAATYAREAIAVRTPSVVIGGWSRWCETEALVCAGDAELAATDARRFGECIGDNRRYRIPYLRALAVLARWRGDLAQAIDQLQEAGALAEQLGLPAELWPIHAALGALHRSQGDQENARRCICRAGEIVGAIAATIHDGSLRSGFLSIVPIQPG